MQGCAESIGGCFTDNIIDPPLYDCQIFWKGGTEKEGGSEKEGERQGGGRAGGRAGWRAGRQGIKEGERLGGRQRGIVGES